MLNFMQTKTHIIDAHTDAVQRLNQNRRTNRANGGGFFSVEAEEMDRSLQREVSQLGQIHNPRISQRSLAALALR